MRFSRSSSGFGTSGVSTGQFEFDIYDELGQYSTAIMAGMTARLAEKNSVFAPSRNYYISKRGISKNVCHFVAYDIMAQSDRNFDASALYVGESGVIPCGNVLDAVKNQCGFTSIRTTSTDGMDFINFTPEMLEGKTCRGVLEMVSTAMCGVWVADQDDGAVLRCLGMPFPGYTSTAKEYAEIDYQGAQKITKLVVTDSETGNVREFSTGEYGTVIAIETPFPDVASFVWSRINGYVYTAWHCDKALIDDAYPDIPVFTEITFGDAALAANNFTIDVDCTGVYFSGGTDPQDDEQWRYEEYLQREVNERVKIGKTVGNTQVTQEGICFVNKNKASSAARNAENTAVEKYGFTVNSGGLIESDGVMSSKKEAESVKIDTDANTVTVTFADGHTYTYSANVAQSGNTFTLTGEGAEWT